MFEDRSTEQLRAELATFQKAQGAKNAEPLPLPPAAVRSALKPEQQETLFENWVSHIYARAPETWTPDESAAIRFAAARVLREIQ